MPQRLGTVPHTESINAKSISSKKPYQVAITQRYPARNQNVRYCMHSPLALYCACQPGRRSQRGVQYLNLQIIQPASPIYQILPIVYLLMNPKRQPHFAIFCHILQYFTIFFDIKNLLIHPVRCQFREYVLLFQPSPASGAGGEWQACVALALTDQSQPASERPSAER